MATSVRLAQEARERLVRQLKAVAAEYGRISPQIMSQARGRRLCAEPREFIISFGSLQEAAQAADVRYSPAASPSKRVREEDDQDNEASSITLENRPQVEELLCSTFAETGVSATSLKNKLGVTFEDLVSFFPECSDLQELARSLNIYYRGKRRTQKVPE